MLRSVRKSSSDESDESRESSGEKKNLAAYQEFKMHILNIAVKDGI